MCVNELDIVFFNYNDGDSKFSGIISNSSGHIMDNTGRITGINGT